MALFIAETYEPLEEVEHFTRSLSGAEVNVAIGLTRLGHKVSYVTKLGDEPMGRYIENFLKKESIGTEYITYDSVYKTGFQLKNRVKKGDPYAPYYRKGSAASHISKKEIDKIDFTEVKLVHITGIPPALSKSCREATFYLIERARENQVMVTFDPNLRPALWESNEIMIQVINDIASRCDVILPGTSEGFTLMGSREPDKIAEFYQKMGVKKILSNLDQMVHMYEKERSLIIFQDIRWKKLWIRLVQEMDLQLG